MFVKGLSETATITKWIHHRTKTLKTEIFKNWEHYKQFLFEPTKTCACRINHSHHQFTFFSLGWSVPFIVLYPLCMYSFNFLWKISHIHENFIFMTVILNHRWKKGIYERIYFFLWIRCWKRWLTMKKEILAITSRFFFEKKVRPEAKIGKIFLQSTIMMDYDGIFVQPTKNIDKYMDESACTWCACVRTLKIFVQFFFISYRFQ